MTRTEPLDPAYRLQPADLTGGAQKLTISAISFQGLEAVQPVAHFVETRKRLLLTPEHCRTLILLTGSTLIQDWIGQVVSLSAAPAGAPETVRLLPPPEPGAARRRLVYRILQRLTALRTRFQVEQSTLHSRITGHAESAWRASPTSRILLWARPLLVIVLLSVVSFFLARAYGAALVALVQGLVHGNGG